MLRANCRNVRELFRSVGQRAFGSIIALMWKSPSRRWPGSTLKQLLVKVRMGERTMIIETPILVMFAILAIGATVWWVYS
jgi:hypothetical protein